MKKLLLILTVFMLFCTFTVSCSCEDEEANGTGLSTGHEHNWDFGKITKSPTKEETGRITYTCSGCKEKREESIPKLAHDHSYLAEWENNRMHHWHACTVKNCTVLSDKASHTWDNGVILEEADHDTTGKKQFTCTVCKYSKEEDYRATTKITESEWQAATKITIFQNVTISMKTVDSGNEAEMSLEISNGHIRIDSDKIVNDDSSFELGSYKISQELSSFDYNKLTYDEGTKAYLYNDGETKASFQFADGRLSVVSINKKAQTTYEFSKYGKTFFELE